MQLTGPAPHYILKVNYLIYRKIRDQGIVAHDLLQPLAVSEPHHALVVPKLGTAIVMRFPGVSMPEVSPRKEAHGVKLGHHVGDDVPYARVFDEMFPVDPRLLAILHNSLDKRVHPDPTVAAVLELQV